MDGRGGHGGGVCGGVVIESYCIVLYIEAFLELISLRLSCLLKR